MKMAEMEEKLDTLRTFLRIIAQDNIKSITFEIPGNRVYAGIDESYSAYRKYGDDLTFDNTLVTGARIYGYIPHYSYICSLSKKEEEKRKTEKNLAFKLMLRAIDHHFRSWFGLEIENTEYSDKKPEWIYLKLKSFKQV